jgi:hypothetical protein
MKSIKLIYDQAVYGDAIETEYEPSMRSMRSVFSIEEVLKSPFDKKTSNEHPIVDPEAPIGDIDDDERESVTETDTESYSSDETRNSHQDDESQKPFADELSGREIVFGGDRLDSKCASQSGEEAEVEESEIVAVEKHLAYLKETSGSEAERVASVEKYLAYLNDTSESERVASVEKYLAYLSNSNTGESQPDDAMENAEIDDDDIVLENSESDDSEDLTQDIEDQGDTESRADNETVSVEEIKLNEEMRSEMAPEDGSIDVVGTSSVVLEKSESADSWDSLNCNDDQSETESRTDDEIVGVQYIISEVRGETDGTPDNVIADVREGSPQNQFDIESEPQDKLHMITEITTNSNDEYGMEKRAEDETVKGSSSLSQDEIARELYDDIVVVKNSPTQDISDTEHKLKDETINDTEPEAESEGASRSEEEIVVAKEDETAGINESNYQGHCEVEIMLNVEQADVEDITAYNKVDDATELVSEAQHFNDESILPKITAEAEELDEASTSTSPMEDIEGLKQTESNDSENPRSLLKSALLQISQLEQVQAEKEAEVKASTDKIVSLEKHMAEQTKILEKEMIVTQKRDSLKIRELQDTLSEALHRCRGEEKKSSSLEKSLGELEELHAKDSSMAKDVKETYAETKELLHREESETIELRSALTKSEKAEEDNILKLREMERKLAIAEERAKHEQSRADALRVTLDDTGKTLEKEMLKVKSFEDTRNATEALESNAEIMERLMKSNAATQMLIDAEKEKITELEEKKFEKETLLEAHQMTVKNTKESLVQYQELIRSEQANVQQLEALEGQRRERIQLEEGQARELEFVLARKSALIELERMKQRTLDSAIAQKSKMVEAEMIKLREYKARWAENQLLLEKEQGMMRSIASAIQEKEELLAAERAVVSYLKTIGEKKKELKKERGIGS